MTKTILIVEDDLTFSTMLKTWLTKKGFQIETASSIATARKRISESDFDLILSDLRLPDDDGFNLLCWKKEMNIDTPLIIMTSYADIQNAVQAMKEGACDYISKPVQPELLLTKINESIKSGSARTAKAVPSAEPAPQPKKMTEAPAPSSDYLEGNSEAARQLYSYVSLVAPTPMSVLINGASGTGKEYVAHRIHQLSRRSDGPFIAIDCGSIPKELAASEFFGHVKGSFTGALADKTGAFLEANGGTIFLDEVGNLSYEVQVQLLRALQERRIRPVGSTKEIEVDVRVVSATNENLEQAIAKGNFREDLYHRLNEFTIQMPTLAQRRDDILLFANFFLQKANRELNRNIMGFDANAAEALMEYSWPGNLRQLNNAIKRATLLAQGDRISIHDFLFQIEGAGCAPKPQPVSMQLHSEEEEKHRIAEALRQTRFNKSKAATMLGIDRKTLYNKLKLYGIE